MSFRSVCAALTALILAGCGTSNDGPVDPGLPEPAAAVCDPYDGPAPAALAHYEGMMHEHSAYSDGEPHFIPADYYAVGLQNGYDYMAGSEHSDSLDAGNFVALHASCDPTSDRFDPTALEYCFLNPTGDKLQKWLSTQEQVQAASSERFLAIRGFEWTSDVFGHINVYFSQNFTNAKTDGGYALTMDTFWDWFTRDPQVPGLAGAATAPVPFGGGADGLAHFNHPHDKCLTEDDPTGLTSGFCDWNDYAYVADADLRMFGMEVYNDGNREDRYLPYYARALDKGWHLSPVGSEDEHFAEYAVEHRPKTVTLAQGLSEADFRDAWLARRSYALSPGQHLRAELLVDRQAPMGARLNCPATAGTVPLSVKMTQRDGTPFSGVFRLFGSGGEELATHTGSAAEFELPVEAGAERWYFVRVDAPEGGSVAYLAPVWITGR